MTEEILKLQKEIIEAVQNIDDLQSLERLRTIALGKKGVITEILGKLGQMIRETKE